MSEVGEAATLAAIEELTRSLAHRLRGHRTDIAVAAMVNLMLARSVERPDEAVAIKQALTDAVQHMSKGGIDGQV